MLFGCFKPFVVLLGFAMASSGFAPALHTEDRLETVHHDLWIYEGGPHWNDGLDPGEQLSA